MLQRVLNGTARVIFGGDSRHHVTPLLHDHLPTGVQGNPRPGTMLSQRTVHPSFDCSQLFYYRSVSWNSLPLDIRCTPALSTFKNMLKIHLFTSLTDCVTECEQRTLYGALVVTSHVTAPYKLSFYYYYYCYYYAHQSVGCIPTLATKRMVYLVRNSGAVSMPELRQPDLRRSLKMFLFGRRN